MALRDVFDERRPTIKLLKAEFTERAFSTMERTSMDVLDSLSRANTKLSSAKELSRGARASTQAVIEMDGSPNQHISTFGERRTAGKLWMYSAREYMAVVKELDALRGILRRAGVHKYDDTLLKLERRLGKAAVAQIDRADSVYYAGEGALTE